MAKILFIVLAIAAIAVAKPMGGAVVSHGSHMSSHVVSPHMGMYGLGYGMFGYPGVIGHTISSHSVAHMPHYGMYGLGMKGLYPGLGMGYGYGLMG